MSQSDREAIAAAIQAVVPEGWSVLPAPPPIEPVPSIVVGPGAPYVQHRQTFRGPDTKNYRLTVVHQVAAGSTALDTLDEVLDLILPLLDTVALNIRWESVSTAGDIQNRAGKDVVVALIPITVE